MGERRLRARSIGSRADTALRPGTTGRVLATFSRVCALITDRGVVVALMWDKTERGPLTVLLEQDSAGAQLTGLAVDVTFEVVPEELRLFGSRSPFARVDLSDAMRWEGNLPWQALRARRRQIQNSLEIVSRAVGEAQNAVGLRWRVRLGQATDELLRAHLRRDRSALLNALRAVCGLGEGLTPQGDDWLAGWLLGLRLSEPEVPPGWGPQAAGALVLDVAASQTTCLSQSFLACAAAGEAGESWHLLLSRMACRPADEGDIKAATRTILGHGATSGVAMLEGFLAGLSPDRGLGRAGPKGSK